MTLPGLCAPSVLAGQRDSDLPGSKHNRSHSASTIEAKIEQANSRIYAKDYSTATDLYVSLFQNADSTEQRDALIFRLAPRLRLLVALDPNSGTKIRALRNSLSQQTSSWLLLNYALGDDEYTMRWFNAIGSVQNNADLLKKNRDVLQRTFTRQKKYALVANLYPNPLESLNEIYGDVPKESGAEKTFEKKRRIACYKATAIYGALLSAGRISEADEFERELLKRDSSKLSRSSLAWFAFQFKHVQYHHLLWICTSDQKYLGYARVWLVLTSLLIVLVSVSLTDQLYRHYNPKFITLPNGLSRYALYLACTVPGVTVVISKVLLNSSFTPDLLTFIALSMIAFVIMLVDRVIYGIRCTQSNKFWYSNKFKECADYAYETMKLFPRDQQWYITAGLSQQNLSNHQEALTLLEKGLAYNPKSAKILGNLIAVATEDRDSNRALVYSERLLQVANNVQKSEAHTYRAAALRIAFRFEEALAEVSKAKPYYGGQLERALALAGLNRFDEAMEACKSALQYPPHSSALDQLVKAAILFEMGDFSRAKEYCETLCSEDSKDAQFALTIRGMSNCGLGLLDEAEADVLRIESMMTMGRALVAVTSLLKSFIQIHKSDFNRALVFCREANDLIGQDPMTLTTLGVIFSRTGQIESALQAFADALKIDPYCASAFWYRHELFQIMGETDKAKEDRLVAEKFRYKPFLPASTPSGDSRQSEH